MLRNGEASKERRREGGGEGQGPLQLLRQVIMFVFTQRRNGRLYWGPFTGDVGICLSTKAQTFIVNVRLYEIMNATS